MANVRDNFTKRRYSSLCSFENVLRNLISVRKVIPIKIILVETIIYFSLSSFLQITLRPYVVKEAPVEPTNAPRTDSKWATLIPAIAVPVVVILFLICAFVWTRFVAKRKREQKKVEPLKVISFISLL